MVQQDATTTHLATLSDSAEREQRWGPSSVAQTHAERVVGQTNTTLDYAATVFEILGIDGSKEYHTEDGRPVMLNNGGKPIAGVIA